MRCITFYGKKLLKKKGKVPRGKGGEKVIALPGNHE